MTGADALNERAIAEARRGNLPQAVQLFESALALAPDAVATLCNLGTILNAQSRFADALPRFARACEIAPRVAEAWNGLGGAQLGLSRFDEAIASFDRATAIEPRHVLAVYNRALAQYRRGRAEEALGGFDVTLVLSPGFAAAMNNRGLCLARLGRHEEADAAFAQAETLDPRDPDIPYNRAQSLRNLGRLDPALAACDRALALSPGFAKAHCNRGNVLEALGCYADALAAFDRALAIDAGFTEARFNRGALLSHAGRVDEAVKDLERARELAPGLPRVAGALAHARLLGHDWEGLDELVREITEGVRAGRAACDPFVFLSLSGDADDQLACARAWNAGKVGAPPLPVALRDGARRLRVAYVSADLRDHPVGHLMAGVIERHDRERFEVVGVAYGRGAGDAITARIRAACDRWLDVAALDDATAASRLREIGIDVAVDLSGPTHEGRPGIFGLRAAPVQVSYLGYPGTSGAAWMDAIIADDVTVPRGRERAYEERVVRLPVTFQANGASRSLADPPPAREEEGLPGDAAVLCCFNNAYKVNPAMFAAWMRVLGRVDGAVLWMLGGPGEARLRDHARRQGVDPSRIVFAQRAPRDRYLARLRLADLFVDTHPYNAGTTASDALWAGLPLLTLAGDAYASRMAASLLIAAGLPDLVTTSLADYESLAVSLARDAEARAALRDRLARGVATGPLFDTGRFTRDLEAALASMQPRQAGAGMV